MSASLKKHIRLEKGKIRRDIADFDQQKKMISELTQRYSIKDESNRNLQPGVK
jgi:hypothetical protein